VIARSLQFGAWLSAFLGRGGSQVRRHPSDAVDYRLPAPALQRSHLPKADQQPRLGMSEQQ